jgi:1,4-alpha-glucan branching enzyme
VGVGEGGKYKLILDSDAMHLGGQGRVPWDPEMFSQPEGEPGKPETNFNNRPHSIVVQSPSRTVVVYANMDQKDLWARATRTDVSKKDEAEAGFFFAPGKVKSFF